MITGLKWQISSADLQKLMLSRVEYHKVKADFYSAEVKRLAPALEQMNEEAEELTLAKYNTSNSNSLNDFKQQAKHHKDRVSYFAFYSSHLVPDEVYQLSEAELNTLEVVGRGY